MDESELLPEDEFADALNDETFGGDGDEYKWEESQALLFEDLHDIRSSNGERQQHELLPTSEIFEDNGARGEYEDFGVEAEPTRDIEYDDFENENALEESISRLVLDEYEDDDEEVARRRIAASKSNYPFFMPPQVVNRHLSFFMDREMPGGSSLLGSSVWSMHPTTISTSTNVAPTTRTTVSSHQILTQDNSSAPSIFNASAPERGHGSSTALSAGTDLSNLLGLVKQQPLEAAILPGPPHQPTTGTAPPTFKTVDEIEEEMMREATKAKVESKEPSAQDKARPRIMSVEELERELMQGSSASSTPGTVTPKPNVPLPQSTGIRSTERTVPGLIEQQQQQQPQHFDATKIPPNRPSAAAAAAAAVAAQIRLAGNLNPNQIASAMAYLRQGTPYRTVLPRPVFTHPNNFNPNIMTSQGMAQAALHQLRQQQQQQQMRFLQMNSHPASHVHNFRMGFPMPPHNLRNMPPGFPGPRMHQQNFIGRRHDTKTEQRLMNEKDKQRLRNIQIVQLQNDHPYATDYYCLMRKVKLAGPGNPQKDILRMLFPKKNEDDDGNKKQYEPAHFENSLGKLQAQSALAPKKAIDTVIRVTENAPVSGKERRSYRYLLMEIEKLYETVLAIEEGDIRVSLGTGGSEQEQVDRKKLRLKMEKILTNPQKLAEIMVVKKGRFLICRCAPLMDPTVRTTAVLFLLKTYPSWIRLNGDNVDLFSYIRYCILNMDSSSFESLCLGLTENVLQSMVISKLGISLLMAILHEGEKLLLTPKLTDQFKTVWTTTVYAVWMTVFKNKQNLAQPVEIYNIWMRRQLLGDTYVMSPQLKEEIRTLLTGFLLNGTHLSKAED